MEGLFKIVIFNNFLPHFFPVSAQAFCNKNTYNKILSHKRVETEINLKYTKKKNQNFLKMKAINAHTLAIISI